MNRKDEEAGRRVRAACGPSELVLVKDDSASTWERIRERMRRTPLISDILGAAGKLCQKLLRRGSRLRWASLGLARRPRRLGQGTAEDLPQSIAVHRRPYTARKLRQTSA